jgi:hypothetical protein
MSEASALWAALSRRPRRTVARPWCRRDGALTLNRLSRVPEAPARARAPAQCACWERDFSGGEQAPDRGSC